MTPEETTTPFAAGNEADVRKKRRQTTFSR
jgi:hypothetical protein